MNRTRNNAFTLVEVMFAVITLGIGLIMVAAIFPVAIQQRKLVGEETSAAASGAAAMQVMGDLGRQGGMLALPATDTVQPLPANHWNAVRGNLILPSDPRMAWVPLYRRPNTSTGVSPTAQVFVIGVQIRNTSVFEEARDTVAQGGAPYANLYPRQGRVTIDKIDDVYYADFAPMAADDNYAAVAEGMFIVISDDGLSGGNAGRMNGRIYRVGNRREDLGADVYELSPGWEFKPDPGADGVLDEANGGPAGSNSSDDIVNLGTGGGATCWFMGRGFADPVNPGDPPLFSGPAMDVAIYTGFISCAN